MNFRKTPYAKKFNYETKSIIGVIRRRRKRNCAVIEELEKQDFEIVSVTGTLTYHVNYYLAGLLNVFKGGELEIRDKYSFDLTPIESENDWKNLINKFVINSEIFVREVAKIPDRKLDETFVDEKYGTYWRNIEGIVEHSYYHLGQLSLIRKIQKNDNRK